MFIRINKYCVKMFSGLSGEAFGYANLTIGMIY